MTVHVEVRTSAAESGGMNLVVRKARLADVRAMHRVINHYAEKQRMLPKTELQLYENLRDYSVVTEADQEGVLACGALHIYWENLAEIRAIAVDSDTVQKGLGTALVRNLLDEAKGIPQAHRAYRDDRCHRVCGRTHAQADSVPQPP